MTKVIAHKGQICITRKYLDNTPVRDKLITQKLNSMIDGDISGIANENVGLK